VKTSLSKFIVVALLFVASLLALPEKAAAQEDCSFGFTTVNMSDIGMRLHSFKAVTINYYSETLCQLWGLQSEAWIYGAPIGRTYCLQSDYTAGGTTCVDYTLNGSSATAWIEMNFVCGAAYGQSKHWVIDRSDTWHQLNGGATVSTYLYAGICRTWYPPSASCDEWAYWDEEDQACITWNSPILVPLTRRQDYKLTNVRNGVVFDFKGDGSAKGTAWTAHDSKLAFLAYDRNGNGIIDNGTELFGNYTVAGLPNGFEALAKLNKDLGGAETAVIDADAPLFAKLLLWEDANHNGLSEASELQPASNVVSGIGLGYSPHDRRDGFENLFAFRGFAHVRTAPGKNMAQSPSEDAARQINLYDVVFASKDKK
jgi:hypothetical protein